MRVGELCAGYNGLGMAVEEVFGATPAWFSEFDPAPSKILAHHYPDVPNYGDMTKIDWAEIEAADIISGGTPCQDLSTAGKRRGMTEGTRSNLWVQMREAIAIQKPTYVVWENVRGAYSAEASSDLEQCPGCVGDTSDGRVFLRALGRVLGDLSDLGYDTQWRGVRAGSETNEGFGVTHVGSCHARYRVFVLAAHRDYLGEHGRWERPEQDRRGQSADSGVTAANASGAGLEIGRFGRIAPRTNTSATPLRDNPPTAHSGSSAIGEHAGGTPSEEAGPNQGDGPCDPSGAWLVGDGRNSSAATNAHGWDDDGWLTGALWEAVKRIAATWSSETNWGEYEPAIRRWEFISGRTAPRPTEPTGRNGGERLSPRFTEWMMGLPDGWVTDPAISISRNEQLKACGNGVVPQQAKAALRDMIAAFDQQEAAA